MTADIGGTNTPIAVDETRIAWESDVKHKFGPQTAQNFNLQENAAYRGGGTITGRTDAEVTVAWGQVFCLGWLPGLIIVKNLLVRMSGC